MLEKKSRNILLVKYCYSLLSLFLMLGLSGVVFCREPEGNGYKNAYVWMEPRKEQVRFSLRNISLR
jgi:hypothetical protein